jgi:hypothetical protein
MLLGHSPRNAGVPIIESCALRSVLRGGGGGGNVLRIRNSLFDGDRCLPVDASVRVGAPEKCREHDGGRSSACRQASGIQADSGTTHRLSGIETPQYRTRHSPIEAHRKRSKRRCSSDELEMSDVYHLGWWTRIRRFAGCPRREPGHQLSLCYFIHKNTFIYLAAHRRVMAFAHSSLSAARVHRSPTCNLGVCARVSRKGVRWTRTLRCVQGTRQRSAKW